MAVGNSKIIAFFFIPLILSIGIAPVLPFDFVLEADALKSKGNSMTEIGSKKVCGDRLCSEPPRDATSKTEEKPIMEKETMTSNGIELPPYPDQPSIHPKLLAANDFWSPPQVHKVTDGIYSAVGFDGANSIMIEGDDGLIIVDTLSNYEAAKKVISEFRKITDKPVKAIIYSHGHMDHVHGTTAPRSV